MYFLYGEEENCDGRYFDGGCAGEREQGVRYARNERRKKTGLRTCGTKARQNACSQILREFIAKRILQTRMLREMQRAVG
jgi:hypothetical protein